MFNSLILSESAVKEKVPPYSLFVLGPNMAAISSRSL